MNLNLKKQTLELKGKTQEKNSSLSIYVPENLGENKGVDKHQIYRTIFCCKYAVVKD